ncbi:hypothetical protein [Desulfotomaculum sp. 1211_IL3151]|uniref:hypothetical protein n=1 Tax=Desulfotomaculum sp. 1211_IL3151 TaxID=3084055 RepID=UPI002FDA5BB3
MYFTEGPLRKFERMMQEKPKREREPVKTAKTRDCKHCLHFDEHSSKCSKEKCALFGDEQVR